MNAVLFTYAAEINPEEVETLGPMNYLAFAYFVSAIPLYALAVYLIQKDEIWTRKEKNLWSVIVFFVPLAFIGWLTIAHSRRMSRREFQLSITAEVPSTGVSE